MDWSKAIFLAHVSEDKEHVRHIHNELSEAGLYPWLDEVQLSPGVEWDSAIKQAIRKSRFFIAFLSPNSIHKNGYYQKELRLALSQMEEKTPGTVYIIPAMLADIEIPDITIGTVNLQRYQSVRLYEPYVRQEFNKLISALQREMGVEPQPQAQPNQPRRKYRILSANVQMSLFPITKAELEQEYSQELLKRIQPLLSFDYSSLDNFHPGQEEEIRFFAGIQSLSDRVSNPALVDFLLSMFPSNEPVYLRDMYFDVFKSRWQHFSHRESQAIEDYLENIDIDELLDILEQRVPKDIAVDELLALRKEVLDRIESMFSEPEYGE